jgi:RimJ/RimL family protein N-acetyltransferase
MQTNELEIRPLAAADAWIFFDLVQRNKDRLANFFAGVLSRTQTLDDTRNFVADATARREAKTYFAYLVFQKDSNTLVGFLDLKNIDWSIPKAEIGCYTDRHHAGKGVAKAAMRSFIDHCFREHGFNKLLLRTHKSNESAIRVALHSGFVKEGAIRCDYKTTAGELVDLLYFGLLRSEWEEMKHHLTP